MVIHRAPICMVLFITLMAACMLTSTQSLEVETFLKDSFLGRVVTLKEPSLKSEIVIGKQSKTLPKKVPPLSIAGAIRIHAVEVGGTWVKLKGKRVVLVGKELNGLVDSEENVSVKLDLDDQPNSQNVKAAIAAVFRGSQDFQQLRHKYFVDVAPIPGDTSKIGQFKDGRPVYRASGRVDAPLPTKTFTPAGLNRKDAKKEASVVAWVVANENGFPEILEIKKTTNPEDSLFALKTLANWRFTPSKLDGKPVAVATEITLDWRNGWW